MQYFNNGTIPPIYFFFPPLQPPQPILTLTGKPVIKPLQTAISHPDKLHAPK